MIRKILSSIALSLIALFIIAVPVIAATYSATFTVSETTGLTSYTMLPVIKGSPNAWMAANGFMKTTALDTRIETLGGDVKPHMVTDNRTLTAIPVGLSSQTNLYFTTGNSDLVTMDIITGYGGYFNYADDPDLEIGNNGTIEFTDAYIDTTASGTDDIIFQHYDDTNGGIKVFRSGTVSENITASVYTLSAGTTDGYLIPDSGGDYTALTPSAGNNWDCVNDVVGAPDDDATYVKSTIAGWQWDAYNIQSPSGIIPPSPINSITVLVRAKDAIASPQADYGLRLNGVEVKKGAFATSGAYTNYSSIIARPGGGSWSYSDLENLEIIVGMYGTDVRCTQTYIIINYTEFEETQVSATSVTSDEYDLSVSLTGGTLGLYLDGVLQDSTPCAGVPDSTDDYTVGLNNTMPYIGSLKHYVDGAQVVLFDPNTMIIGSTLPDREPTGGSNDGTITWGLNPVGVSVSLGPLMGEESAPSFIDDPDTLDVLPGAGSSDWYIPPDIGVGGSLLTNPLRPFVLILSDTTTLTERQAWVLLGIAFVLLVLVITAKTVHGHHIITGIATGAAIGLCVVQTIFPFYSIIFIIASILVGAVAERSQSL